MMSCEILASRYGAFAGDFSFCSQRCPSKTTVNHFIGCHELTRGHLKHDANVETQLPFRPRLTCMVLDAKTEKPTSSLRTSRSSHELSGETC